MPGIDIDHQRIISSDDAIHMKTVPKSMAIMGSGAVGVEFGSIFNTFGSEVTIIELLPRIVPNEDEAVSAELEKIYRKRKIKVLTGTRVTSAVPGKDSVTITAEKPDGSVEMVTAEYLLVATGRGPVTTGLGAEEVGLKMQRGYIQVDELYRTSVPGISAVGDVITFEAPGAPAARAPVVDGGHHRGRAHRGPRREAPQLRPRAGLHLL